MTLAEIETNLVGHHQPTSIQEEDVAFKVTWFTNEKRFGVRIQKNRCSYPWESFKSFLGKSLQRNSNDHQ